eukprot:3506617-Pyramimonas_sp.AAC.2
MARLVRRRLLRATLAAIAEEKRFSVRALGKKSRCPPPPAATLAPFSSSHLLSEDGKKKLPEMSWGASRAALAQWSCSQCLELI